MAASRAANAFVLPHDVQDVFLSYSILRKDGSAQSHELLRKAASIAAPIARKRGWKVGHLREFQPKSNSLYGLNVNRGQEICVRTRRDGSATEFLDFESILHTLLHELVHIVHGPHSAAFYDMLDVLQTEAFRVQRGIVDIAGKYWGTGQKLGGCTRAPRLLSSLPSNGQGKGYRLGGAPVELGVSAKEAAARAALARRRKEDDMACGTQDEAAEEEDSSKGNQESGKDLLRTSSCCTPNAAHWEGLSKADIDSDIIEIIPDQNVLLESGKQTTSHDDIDRNKRVHVIDLVDDDGDSIEDPDSSKWICARCTYSQNSSDSLKCIACNTVRPDLWECDRCSYANLLEHLQCGACCSIRA